MSIFNPQKTVSNILETREEVTENMGLQQENLELNAEVRYLGSEIRELQEDFLRISDAFDNVGWEKITGMPEADSNEISLDTVKKVAKISRSMYTMNPFVKRGVNARIQYVWGKSVNFDGVDDIYTQMEDNRAKLFSPQAFEEYERVLATDGNAFTALPIGEEASTNLVFRVNLDEITSAVSNPLDREDVWFLRRDYTVRNTNSQSGEVTTKHYIKYYMTLPYYQRLVKLNKPIPKRWNTKGVEQNFVIQHMTVNRQIGWRWGVPDVMPVIFWAKAYKEYLEDNALLVKAYSRLAWNYKAPSAAGGAAAGATIMRPPSRDPMTGEINDIGGTAITGLGGELSPIAPGGSAVDFSKGSPLASAIAAGLEVSLVVITSDPGSGNRATAETLDLPTLKAMESRQKIHSERFLQLFNFWGVETTAPLSGSKSAKEIQESEAGTPPETEYAIVTWPQIETDTTLDRVKAIGTAVELGVVFKQEARKEILDFTNMTPYRPWYELPTLEDDPAAKEKQAATDANAEIAFNREQETSKVVSAQGVSGGTSAKGGATSANSARTNRSSNTNNS